MSIIHELVKDIPIPKMLKVKQTFADERLSDVEETLHQELDQEHIRNTIKPGMEIAIAVGSRGVDKIVEVTAQTVKFLQDLGAKPFIVPSMGSHGGATAEGQQAVLAHLGVTEETVNAEIRSSMEVIKIGELDNGYQYILINLLLKQMVLSLSIASNHIQLFVAQSKVAL